MTADTIDAAARWLAETPRDGWGGPAVPALKARFGLTAREAVDAIVLAGSMRDNRRVSND